MNEPLNQVERRLTQLRPRDLSRDLESRIAAGLAETRRFDRADLRLWSAIVAGALAACIAIVVIVREPVSSAPGRAISFSDIRSPRAGNSMPALARVDARWADELDLNRRLR